MLIVTAVLGCLVAATGEGEGPNRFEFTQLAMGDRARIVLYAAEPDSARAAAAAAFARIDELERVMSDYRADSEVTLLATRGAEAGAASGLRISEDLFGVLHRAKSVAEATGGAFDPTMGPVVRLWREARRSGRMPSDEARAAALALVGHDRLVLEPARTARLREPGMQIDLGGIGKGYGADAAAAVLEGSGFRSFLVALGGDIVAGAAPPGEEGWRITVGPGEGQDVLVERGAVSSSGDSEQFVEIGGVRYSHIVDPRTGLGVVGAPLVTVVAPCGALADAAATALSVLGEAGVETVSQGLGIEARLDPPSGPPVLTAGFPRAGGAAFQGRSPARPGDAPPGFRRLLSGTDLSGWTAVAADPPDLARLSPEDRTKAEAAAAAAMPAHWSVEDGVLRFAGAGTSLRTVEEFADFELLVDWKIAPGGDSGIYLRACPQVQIWDNPAGSGGLYNNQKTGAQPLHVADRPPGEWNTFRIVMTGAAVTVYLNGQLVVDRAELENLWDRAAPVPERGPIWLQAHGTPLWFRGIFIRELGQ